MKYQIDSAIRCVELLYKVFQAWDIEYPLDSEYIQELIFKMKSVKKVPATSSVITDDKYHLKDE